MEKSTAPLRVVNTTGHLQVRPAPLRLLGLDIGFQSQRHLMQHLQRLLLQEVVLHRLHRPLIHHPPGNLHGTPITVKVIGGIGNHVAIKRLFEFSATALR